MPQYTVSKDDELFIAICKMADDITKPHHFLVIGIMRKGYPVLLARLGKANNIMPESDSSLTVAGKFLFQTTVAHFQYEGIARKNDYQSVTEYSAYAITYEQFRTFLLASYYIYTKQLQHYTKTKELTDDAFAILACEFKAVVPISSTDGDTITLEYKSLRWFAEQHKDEYGKLCKDGYLQALAKTFQTLNVWNSCKTSSLQLLEYVLGGRVGLSSSFLAALHNQTILKARKFEHQTQIPFYIMPLTQAQIGLKYDAATSALLEKLYTRLDEIRGTKEKDKLTAKKFSKIKSLYLKIASIATHKTSELDQVLGDFVENNKDLFVHRRVSIAWLLGISTATEAVLTHARQSLRDAAPAEVPLDEAPVVVEKPQFDPASIKIALAALTH